MKRSHKKRGQIFPGDTLTFMKTIRLKKHKKNNNKKTPQKTPKPSRDERRITNLEKNSWDLKDYCMLLIPK